MPRREILTYEEILRVASAFHQLGVRKLRITGGEPLLRRDLGRLLRSLATLENVDLALTTNASLLSEQASELAAAGLKRVTVSLDALEDRVFRAMNDVDFPVERVLEGVEAALAAGLAPVKINVVVQRGVNEREVVDIARYFKGMGPIVRFIEFMDVGTTNAWRMEDVVPAAEILQLLCAEFELEPVEPNYPGEVARRWRHTDGSGEIGIIASVTQPFCGDCTRARLSAEGKLFTCLFAASGTDLRAALRGDGSQEELVELIAGRWRGRSDRYSEARSGRTVASERVEMSYIGG